MPLAPFGGGLVPFGGLPVPLAPFGGGDAPFGGGSAPSGRPATPMLPAAAPLAPFEACPDGCPAGAIPLNFPSPFCILPCTGVEPSGESGLIFTSSPLRGVSPLSCSPAKSSPPAARVGGGLVISSRGFL